MDFSLSLYEQNSISFIRIWNKINDIASYHNFNCPLPEILHSGAIEAYVENRAKC